MPFQLNNSYVGSCFLYFMKQSFWSKKTLLALRLIFMCFPTYFCCFFMGSCFQFSYYNLWWQTERFLSVKTAKVALPSEQTENFGATKADSLWRNGKVFVDLLVFLHASLNNIHLTTFSIHLFSCHVYPAHSFKSILFFPKKKFWNKRFLDVVFSC